MRPLSLLKKVKDQCNKNFSLKIFVLFTIFILIISVTFIGFFIHQESKSLTSYLIRKGEILARLLADNSRLGVFSENDELLKDPIAGVFEQEEILEISIFNMEGNLLKREEKKILNQGRKRLVKTNQDPDINKISKKLYKSGHLFYIENKDRFEFWASVVSGAAYAREEFLFFKMQSPQENNRIIGFVNIIVDKIGLEDKIKALVWKAILIGILGWSLGSIIIYFVVKRMTRPLKKLTEGVITFGQKGLAENVPVETCDEIGKLAIAFNNMAGNLKKREMEKIQLEEQLRHAQKMEAIGTLTGGIAHDFNNILTVIIGYSNLLQIEIDEYNPSRYSVEQILISATRAASLVRGLLAFSRKQIMDIKPINCNEIIKDAKELLGRIISEDIEFKIDLIPEDLVIMGDSGQLGQVLFNLVTNARDAMPNGGVLAISTELVKPDLKFFNEFPVGKKADHYALIKVSDTGIGIDSNIQSRIFDPFFTTKEVGKGTGLGLSIVYGIIKQHDGYIEVSSKPGQGTTFKIFLPLTNSKIKDQKLSTVSDLEGGSVTILLAEDDEQIKNLSQSILHRYGYKVIVAVDGEEAVRKFMEHKEEIQILLFDVIMPKKNGKEAYDEIRKMKSDIKVLFISGYDQQIIQKKGIHDNGINIIYKPVSPSFLLKKVKELVAS